MAPEGQRRLSPWAFLRLVLPQGPQLLCGPLLWLCGEVRPGRAEPDSGTALPSLSSRQAQAVSAPPPRKTRAQLLDDILVRMRDPRNVTEAPLGTALAPGPQLPGPGI